VNNSEIQLKNLPFKMVGPDSDKSVFAEIVKHKVWEPNVTQIISTLLRNGDTFIDVGSNIGYYLLLGSHFVGPSGKVIGFEPVPINYHYCQQNININKIRNVEINPIALWNVTAKEKMVIPNEHLGNCQIQNNGEFEIDCIPLDSLNLDPNLIKIDVEGAEPFALEGMKNTLKKSSPDVVIEMNRLALHNGFGLDAEVYWEFFQSIGYSISLIGPDASLNPIMSLEELKSVCPPDSYVDLLCKKDIDGNISISEGVNIKSINEHVGNSERDIKVSNEDIDVQELMHNVRERVRKRRENDCTRSKIKVINPNSCEVHSLKNEIQIDLDYINSNKNIQDYNYIISTHRPIIGRFLVEGRKLVNGELHRYVDPIISRQIDFNSSLTRILNRITTRFAEIDNQLEHVKAEIREELANQQSQTKSEIDNQLEHVKAEIREELANQQSQTKSEIDGQLEHVRAEIREELANQQSQTKSEIDNQLEHVRAEIREELANQQSQTKSEIDNQSEHVRAEIREELANQQSQTKSEIDNQLEHVRAEIREELDRKIKTLVNNESVTKPWSNFYNNEVNEEYLTLNVSYHERLISLIKEYAQKAADGTVPKLLEVGLGTATMSIYFSRYSFEVTGIDNDQTIIRNAIKTNKDLGGYAKFILIDAFELDLFKDKYFDIAFSQGTMEHFNDEEIIELISKQLEIAKYVIFSVPSINFNYPNREFGNERKMVPEDWELILKKGKFNIVDIGYYKDNQHIVCIIRS